MIKIKNITIRCPNCKIPFAKIYFDGKQSYLKWYNGKMNETFCKGIYEINCFRCGTEIKIITQLLTRVFDKE